MTVRTFIPLVATVLVVASLATASAQAEGSYVGGSLGTSHFSDPINGVNGESGGLSGKLYGGYQLNANVAAELGYARLGHVDNSSGTVTAHGLYLDAVGLWPLGANVAMLGSAGLAHVKLDTSHGDDQGMGLKLGLGADYALNRLVSVRAEYEHYRPAEFGGHPSIGQFSVGVRAGF